jgi:hypothetical protein
MSMNPPRPRRYAEQTHVEAKQSRVEIEALLKRAGAIDITWPEEFEGKALVYFKPERRPIRIAVPLPRKPEPPAPVSRRSWAADYDQAVHRRYERAEKSYQQQVRQRWRGLLLLIKAKFEAIASGLEPVDVAFLPYLELPGGGNLGERIVPQIAHAMREGRLPDRLMLGPGESTGAG